jgi:hypothetical protein
MEPFFVGATRLMSSPGQSETNPRRHFRPTALLCTSAQKIARSVTPWRLVAVASAVVADPAAVLAASVCWLST